MEFIFLNESYIIIKNFEPYPLWTCTTFCQYVNLTVTTSFVEVYF